MPPKQDTHAERITAIESQISDIATLIGEMRAEAKENFQRTMEAEKCMEERLLQAQSSLEKQPGVIQAAITNLEEPGFKS